MNTKDESVIPKGMYCYTRLDTDSNISAGFKVKLCPYWEKKAHLPEQSCGYCNYLELGDADENGTFLLWDMVKECGVNDDY